MKAGVIYDVVDRSDPTLQIGWIKDGQFFNASKSPAVYCADLAGKNLVARGQNEGVVLGQIDGLTMSRNGNGRVFDLVPRAST
ncbi:hypothetical protein DZC30_00670 [Comamonas testosteroni]|uniref:Uncharacterized protein n=1 Tax=Comamonas testosteroni TaxID=285 RepID=A0A373FS14_COMTE|nr:hypothetical protein [Comamonas testosteroni]RGE46954.1 hypothetical protein DZC30_00670 [Comamonas testosteroni]